MIRFFTIAALVALSATQAFAISDTENLKAELKEALTERLSLPSEAIVEVHGVRVGNSASFEQAEAIVRVELVGGVRVNSLMAAKVVLGGVQGAPVVWVRFRANVESPVVVTRHPMLRGSKISKADVRRVMRTMTRVRGYSNISDVIGRAVKSNIGPGEPLHLRNTKSSATLKRGDLVSVMIRMGGVELQTTGESLQRGSIGDRIRVRITTTGKTTSALVKSTRLVEVTQ